MAFKSVKAWLSLLSFPATVTCRNNLVTLFFKNDNLSVIFLNDNLDNSDNFWKVLLHFFYDNGGKLTSMQVPLRNTSAY